MKKKLLIFLICSLLPLHFLYASVADIWADDVKDNPSKLFFSSSSLFIGEFSFKDSFLKSGNVPRSFQQPVLDVNISVLGGVIALNLGSTTSMVGKDEPYSYVSTKTRYLDVLVAYGYKYFSLGLNLSLSDEKKNDAEFDSSLPFFSFIGETFFKYYTNVSGSVKTSFGLSLTLTDGNYFSFGLFATDLFVFSDTTTTVDGTSIYKSINIGISAKSPKYNKLDDLIPVSAKLSFDAIRPFDNDKKFSVLLDLGLVLSPSMSFNIMNTLEFNTYENARFNIRDKKFFMHTLATSFQNSLLKAELGVLLSPNLYRGDDREFQMYIKVKFFA